MTLSASEYLIGLVFFTINVGGSGLAALHLLEKRGRQLVGPTRVLAWSVLTTAGILVTHLVPGALGILSRGSVAVATLLLIAGAWRVPTAPAATPVGFPGEEEDEDRPDRWLARYGIAAGAAWLGLAAVEHGARATAGFDAASAYMPTAARWIQEGSIWGFGDWLPGFFFGTSPGNGSTIVLAGMLPWENDFLARFAIFPFLPLMVLATFCLARELRAPRAVAVLLGLSVTALPVVVGPPVTDALLDPVLYATFAAGLAFLVRHHRTNDPTDLMLAGISLGIAFGTKLYGFTAVPIVVGVWLVARLLASVPRPRVLRQTAAVVGLVTAFGGVWVLRNALETGNPIYPVAIPALGLDAPPDPSRGLLGSNLLDYLDQPSVWKDTLFHQFRIATGLPLVLLGVATVVAVVLVLRRRSDRAVGVAGLAAVGLLTLSYFATPYSAVGSPGNPYIAAANVRYGVPALVAAAGLAGWVTARLPRRAVLIVELAALVAFADALQIGTTLSRRQTALAFLIAVPVVLLWPLARPAGERLRRLPAMAIPGLVTLVVVAGVIGGQRFEQHYNAQRFVNFDPALEWVRVNTPDGAPVGIAGAWTAGGVAPIYPAFGARLQNHVTYIGPHTDGLLATYRSETDYARALARSGVGILVLGRAEPFVADPSKATTSAEIEAWSIASGFHAVAQSDRFTVMVRGSE